MRIFRLTLAILFVACSGRCVALSGTPAMKRLLIIGEERLDSGKIDLKNPEVHRKDRDFAVAWAKMYGIGRVYYSTLGHVEQNWDDPRLQQMYGEAIKWAVGLVDADVTPRALPGQTADAGNYERRSATVSEELRPH